MGAVAYAIVNDNHAHEWRYAMESFAEGFPGRAFEKVVVWCDKDRFSNRKGELDNHFNELVEKYPLAFAPATFEIKAKYSWPNEATDYLLEMGSAFQADTAVGHDAYFSIASGNQVIRECALILASLFGVRIFDRYSRSHPVGLDDFYEIPLEQVKSVLMNQPPGTLLGSFFAGFINVQNSNLADICKELSDDNFLGQFYNQGNCLDYSSRWAGISQSLARQEPLLVQMKDQVIANIQLPPGVTLFSVKTEGRVKTLQSLWKKVLKKEAEDKKFIKDPFVRFSDIVGVRVIASCDGDMNQVVSWIASPESPFDDANQGGLPRPDNKQKLLGYKAIHFDVKFKNTICTIPALAPLAGIKCEIQVKTSLSDTWGRLSHLLIYKEKRKTPLTDHDRNRLEKRLKTAAASLTALDEALDQICEDFDPRN